MVARFFYLSSAVRIAFVISENTPLIFYIV
ncbi:hypothetical protein SAM19_02623 [Brevibacillus laterosporus]|nr:hypothetical protein [Brevibacillus laterosporus]